MASTSSKANKDVVNFQLERLAFGGSVGIGLEAQGDIGLSIDRYVRVPANLTHKPRVTLEPIKYGKPCPYGGAWATTIYPIEREAKDATAVYYHRGRYWCFAQVPAELFGTGSANIFAEPKDLADYEPDFDYKKHSKSWEEYCAWHKDHELPEELQADVGAIPAECSSPEGGAAESALVHYHEKRWGTFQRTDRKLESGATKKCILVPFPAKIIARNPPEVTARDLGWFIEHNRRAFSSHPKAIYGITARLFAYITGLMSSSDECEVELIECEGDSSTPDQDIEAVKALIANDNFCSQVLTMCAARTISWRQTSHCTGGNVALGYVLKIMEQADWSATKGRVDMADTDLFYNAFHAVNNRSMMVVLCPDRYETTACFKLCLGVPVKKAAEASVLMRMEARSGVAGTKLLIDSLTVLKAAAVDGMIVTFPCLDNIGVLIQACARVRSNGLLSGSSCRFWVRHNPFGMRSTPVDQRDQSLHNLCKYASIYAVSYMQGSTLAKAKSLINFSKQNPDDGFKKFWIELRKQSAGLKISEASALIHVIQSRRGSVNSADFMSDDMNRRAKAADDIKAILTTLGVDTLSVNQYGPLTDAELDLAKQNISLAENIEKQIAEASARAGV